MVLAKIDIVSDGARVGVPVVEGLSENGGLPLKDTVAVAEEDAHKVIEDVIEGDAVPVMLRLGDGEADVVRLLLLDDDVVADTLAEPDVETERAKVAVRTGDALHTRLRVSLAVAVRLRCIVGDADEDGGALAQLL